MQRIAIVGCPGSGKSTLAKKLGNTLNIPVHSLDSIYWLPGWVKRPVEDYRRLHAEFIVKDTWILDGNNLVTIDERFARADTIIYLDFPRWLCMYAIWSRAIRHVLFRTKRVEVAPGCFEGLDKKFWILVQYVWNFKRYRTPTIRAKLAALRSQKKIVVLRFRKEVADFISQF